MVSITTLVVFSSIFNKTIKQKLAKETAVNFYRIMGM